MNDLSRYPLHCIVPPYIIERLARSSDPTIRACAHCNLHADAAFRAQRLAAGTRPAAFVQASPSGAKHRVVYDAGNTPNLPGERVRVEGQGATQDPAVDEAYEGAGITYDFYEQLFQRRSLDDQGMTLISSVHVAEQSYDEGPAPLNNAFWNGEQMAYGDGDGVVFTRFTQALEVIAHELTHGVQSFTSNLTYSGQSGALNEHFSDVFGVLVRQWHRAETASQADWLIGSEILVPAPTRRGIRDMLMPGTAFKDDPDLGDDPQPAHMEHLYTGTADRGGVHINSGIPNRAFALAARALGGNAWDVAGRIWYAALLQLPSDSDFAGCAALTVRIAGSDYDATARKAVADAWKAVGVKITTKAAR